MKILTVSATEKSREMLRLLLEEGGDVVSLAPSAAAARRRILDEEWDVIVINYPLQDESGLELAHMATTETDASVVMLMRPEIINELSERLAADGILPVEKPTKKQMLRSTISPSAYMKRIKRSNISKLQELERRIEELRIVSKAKCALALKEGLEEEEAHKRIERTAMDRRISLRDAALFILRMME